MPNIPDTRLRLSSLALLTVLAGCATPGPRPDGATAEPRPAAAWPENARLYAVDSEASRLRILVAPAGPLAGLGHHHVIGGPVVSGRIALAEPFADSALELQVDVTGLEVDRPAWREAEGSDFDRQPEADAIAGTRENMLSDRVLDAENHPRIELVATGRMSLVTTEFGIEPFTTAGGGLRVADGLRIRFSIVARAAHNPGNPP